MYIVILKNLLLLYDFKICIVIEYGTEISLLNLRYYSTFNRIEYCLNKSSLTGYTQMIHDH